MTRLRAGWSGVRLPEGVGDFPVLQNVQASSGAHHRGSFFDIMISLRAGWSGVRLPAGVGDYPVLQNVQVSSGYRGSLLGGKVAGE